MEFAKAVKGQVAKGKFQKNEPEPPQIFSLEAFVDFNLYNTKG